MRADPWEDWPVTEILSCQRSHSSTRLKFIRGASRVPQICIPNIASTPSKHHYPHNSGFLCSLEKKSRSFQLIFYIDKYFCSAKTWLYEHHDRRHAYYRWLMQRKTCLFLNRKPINISTGMTVLPDFLL